VFGFFVPSEPEDLEGYQREPVHVTENNRKEKRKEQIRSEFPNEGTACAATALLIDLTKGRKVRSVHVHQCAPDTTARRARSATTVTSSGDEDGTTKTGVAVVATAVAPPDTR